jgi:hypothetical protein
MISGRKKEWDWMDRYPQGYLPKIKYWSQEMISAIDNGDIHRIPLIMQKLEYFTSRQKELEI